MSLSTQHHVKFSFITLLTTLCLFLSSHLALAGDKGEKEIGNKSPTTTNKDNIHGWPALARANHEP